MNPHIEELEKLLQPFVLEPDNHADVRENDGTAITMVILKVTKDDYDAAMRFVDAAKSARLKEEQETVTREKENERKRATKTKTKTKKKTKESSSTRKSSAKQGARTR